MTSTIGTSGSNPALEHSAQRKIDRCQNGVIWSVYTHNRSDETAIRLRYSTTEGATWVDAGGFFSGSESYNFTPFPTLFIDIDDYAHLVYRDLVSGYTMYRRGTPNAGRTSYTWTSAYTVLGDGNSRHSDVIAHREGTGWTVHVVTGYYISSANNKITHTPITVTSGAGITVGSGTTLGSGYNAASYNQYPSIDFHHTGDTKTVKGGTPHLYVAWSSGAAGTSTLGMRFRKATYNAGVWNWGTERGLDTTRYANGPSYWIKCLFDGTRVMMPASLHTGSVGSSVIYERDEADTTTTVREMRAASTRYNQGSATFDASGNIYLIGRASDGATPYQIIWAKWTRGTNSLSADTNIDLDCSSSQPGLTVKNGYSNNKIEFFYTDGNSPTYYLRYGTLSEPPVIAQSSTFYALNERNGRKIDRTSNGVLWSAFWDGTSTTTTSVQFRYSLDNGATWVDPGGASHFGFVDTAVTYIPAISFFIDQDDYAHAAVRHRNGYVYYHRGTPNAARTAWTWVRHTATVTSAVSYQYPDIVAHREGAGWVAHITTSYTSGASSIAFYHPVNISSTSVITLGSTVQLSVNVAHSSHSFPSIDFNHVGDGKTIKGGTPHLYVAWSNPSGTRFKKGSYSGGTWNWGTEQVLDSRNINSNDNIFWLNCLFDGTRVMIPGQLWNGANYDQVLIERDAADTTTTVRVLATNVPNAQRLTFGQATYDASGNIHFIGRSDGVGTSALNYRKWVRATNTFTSLTVFDPLHEGSSPYVNVCRNSAHGSINTIYGKENTGAPTSIHSYNLVLNRNPLRPQNLAVSSLVIKAGDQQGLTWTHSDPENDPQVKYQIRYRKKTGYPGRTYPRKYPQKYQ